MEKKIQNKLKFKKINLTLLEIDIRRSVSLHQNKSANNRQPHDFAISHDESKVRCCKQIFCRNEWEWERRSSGAGKGEIGRSCQGIAREKTEGGKEPPQCFMRTSRSADRIDFNTRTNRRCSENRAFVSRSHKLSEQFAVKHATTRYSPRKKQAFPSF